MLWFYLMRTRSDQEIRPELLLYLLNRLWGRKFEKVYNSEVRRIIPLPEKIKIKYTLNQFALWKQKNDI